ncbi:hypothetical protein BD324DRAFT_639280 [Kockovaella imperatae]|uniref:Peroxisomal targeting signal receptor n=1 Tax=Kockovaella imperatae TaxID=4999 RepID=A0A1Y1U7S1_9TREE|nr:hypothetical protein BD324DRAFT_639280 [Kockovaella imperatae]ORX33557.1 hypothetical protein BD324DRAFT_639280 [Kockovaella imperatae]
MQSLIIGGDKGSGSNPLKQVAQKETVDTSLFRDRFVSKPGAAISRPVPGQSGQSSVPQRQAFNLSTLSSALSGPSYTPQGSISHHENAHFDSSWSSSRQLRSNGQSLAAPGPVFASERARMGTGPSGQSDWAQAFSNDSKGKARAQEVHYHSSRQGYSAPSFQPYRPQIGYQPMPLSLAGQLPQLDQSYGSAFQQRSIEDQKAMEDAFERALEDARHSEAVNENQTEEDVQEMVRDKEDEEKGDFEAVWQSLRPEAERLNKLAEWEKEYSQFVDGEDDLFETLNHSLHHNDFDGTDFDAERFSSGPFGPGFVDDMSADDGIPRHREYDFAPNEETQLSNVAEAWHEAKRLLSVGGSLSEATTLLESFIHRASAEDYAEVNASVVEAWSLLGRTHAMNEKEEKALSAFEEARRAIESADLNSVRGIGETYTNLAISYVNENLDLAALTTLHQYLSTSFPAQAGPAPKRSAVPDDGSPWFLHHQVLDAYLSLAREQFTREGQVEANVQVGLGTLYYMMGQYGEARNCWVAALEERPDDYLLWNRLGATLANGGNSEEAVDAYRRALELRPTFTRAIFNLGVACLNIGVHKEAAEHFLAALALHGDGSAAEGSEGADSMGLWMVLRRALIAMHLDDLAGKALPGTSLRLFKEAGFEF